VALILLGSIVSGLTYAGRTGEVYSPLNHFVSELGDTRYAPRAWAFNAGLFVGGLLITVFMLGVTSYIQGWFRCVFGLAALLTCVSGTLVGLMPMSADLDRHLAVAITFFNAGMAATVLFALYVLLFRQARFPKWMALPGGITALSFSSLLYVVESPIPDDLQGLPLSQALETVLWNRPAIWQTAIVEWVVVLTVLGWVLCVSLYLRRTASG
jgi:hypothetical membrane protein